MYNRFKLYGWPTDELEKNWAKSYTFKDGIVTPISKLGGKLNAPVYFTLPDTDINRSFLIIDKEKNTPKAYPRKAGTPSKEPLK